MGSMEFIGQGTTKRVFEAYDTQLDCKVAICVPKKVDKLIRKEIEIH